MSKQVGHFADFDDWYNRIEKRMKGRYFSLNLNRNNLNTTLSVYIDGGDIRNIEVTSTENEIDKIVQENLDRLHREDNRNE